MQSRFVRSIATILLDGSDFNEIYRQNISPSAITPIENSAAWAPFPNPCTNGLNISAPFSNDVGTITITDASGRMVKKLLGSFNEDIELNTLTLANGVYFLAI